jgi:hypothetical protein
MSLVGPVAFPFVAGAAVNRSLDRTDRQERRQQRELDQARHKIEIAKLRTQETEILEKELERKS